MWDRKRYLWAHVLFSSHDIFLENIFVARNQLHGQTEVDELQFPGHQEIVAGLDVRVNDIDVVNLSKTSFHHIINFNQIKRKNKIIFDLWSRSTEHLCRH